MCVVAHETLVKGGVSIPQGNRFFKKSLLRQGDCHAVISSRLAMTVIS
ncbi:MAG: hypothetical protein IJV56_00835 [Neisseriaceae bacterium]|nr:hypothetical protein [Neisseriaceae bacterium]